MHCSKGGCLLSCHLQDRYFSLLLLLEKDDEEFSASFLCVGFLDLFNRVDLLLSLLVAHHCSEFCLAWRGQLNFEVVAITNQISFISDVSI